MGGMAEEPSKDSPICFFLGAGSSVPAGIPTTVEFADEYASELQQRKEFLASFGAVRALLENWVQEGAPTRGPIDIELLLDCLTQASNAKESPTSAIFDLKAEPALSDPELPLLLDDLRQFVRRRCSVDARQTSYWKSLLGVIQTYGKTHIFSTNYDLVMETFLRSHGYRFSDGFDEGWNPSLFDAQAVQVALYKVHGSVNWYRAASGDYFRLPIRNPPPDIRSYSGDAAESLMLYPAQKFAYAGPFLDMMALLRERLTNSFAVIVIGYSFRDPPIAQLFSEALSNNPSLVVILVDPHAREVYELRLAQLGVELREVLPLNSPTESTSIRGRVFTIPTTIQNASAFLYSTLLPRLIEAYRKEQEVREKELRFEIADYSEVLLKFLQAGFIDRCEVIEPRLEGLKTPSPKPLEYLGRKWAVEAAFRSPDLAIAERDVLYAEIANFVHRYISAAASGGKNFTLRFVVGDSPGSGMISEGSDLSSAIEEWFRFAADFAAFAGAGSRHDWILEEIRSLRLIGPYFRTISTSTGNTEAYFQQRLKEVAPLSKNLEQRFREAFEMWATSGPASEVIEATTSAEFLLVCELLDRAKARTLPRSAFHSDSPIYIWRDRPGPRVADRPP